MTARVISSILLTLSLCLWLGAHTAQGASLEPFQVDPELLGNPSAPKPRPPATAPPTTPAKSPPSRDTTARPAPAATAQPAPVAPAPQLPSTPANPVVGADSVPLTVDAEAPTPAASTADLNRWTGATHIGPSLRPMTPNPRGLPVEAAKALAAPLATPTAAPLKAGPPATRSAGSSAPPQALTVPAATSARQDLPPFEVDPELLGGRRSVDPLIASAPALPAVAKPAPTRSPAADAGPLQPLSVERVVATPRSAPVAAPAPIALGDGNTEIEADTVDGTLDQRVIAKGQAYVRKGWDELFGDTVRWDFTNNQASGEGNIVKRDQDSEVTGTRFVYNQDSQTGDLDDAAYSISSMEARGTAKRFVFDGPGRYRSEGDVKYTTCNFDDPDWLMKADEVDIDKGANEGVAKNMWLLAGGKVPFFYHPKFTFALENVRKSGFLTPSLTVSNRTGISVIQPYYWNIAPNMDATLNPRYMSLRGLQLGGEFRYLGEHFRGIDFVEYMPTDDQTGRQRWAVNLRHEHQLQPNLSASLEYMRVSDDDYFRDLSNRIGITSQRLLPQRGLLAYSGDGWNAVARVQSFQVLQNLRSPITQPYDILPSVRLTGSRQVAGLFNAEGIADVSVFSLGNPLDRNGNLRPEGSRVVMNPAISLPLRGSWGFVIPKLSYNASYYALTGISSGFTLQDLKVGDNDQYLVSAAPKKGVSDLLAEFSGRVLDNTSLITRLQYNTNQSEFQKGQVALRYSPELGKVVNLGYRYTIGPSETDAVVSGRPVGLRQFDLSTQWPLRSNLYALARTNYSLLDKRQTEGLLGLEYLGACWNLRVAVQSLATSTTTVTRAFFVVLELKGLSASEDADFKNLLTRNIGGYSVITPDQVRSSEALFQ
ncbi:MAG: LPS-assembly protein LptD [Betaproteobacteria bacterium]|nr:LPS-assembly protein LptD [Betaproteobacteria bacterium]